MGIRNLIPRIQHKAQPAIWSKKLENSTDLQWSDAGSKIAIVDGPSLAYHVFESIAARRDLCDDSLTFDYQAIVDAFVNYLDALQDHGFTVLKIFFDGALPATKLPTRLARHSDLVGKLAAIRDEYSTCDTRSVGRRWQSTLKSPFLIPAIIEGLSSSSTAWAPQYELVPGEADSWCRRLAQAHSIEHTCDDVFIFSRDSDFLVHDSTRNTYVALLSPKDLQQTENGGPRLPSQTYNPYEIAASVGVHNMLQVGFRMLEDTRLSLTVAASLCSTELSPDQQARFGEYLQALDGADDMTFPMTQAQSLCIQHIDPRVSELIYQAYHHVNPSLFFLAVIPEDAERSSSWLPSVHIRRLAYTILAHGSDTVTMTIKEHDRRSGKSTAVNLLLLEDFATSLLEYNSWIEEKLQSSQAAGLPNIWRLISLAYLIQTLQNEQRTMPDCDDVTEVLVDVRLSTWSNLHMAAQISATLYSFRLLHQIITFVLAGDALVETLRRLLEDLARSLASLPPVLQLFETIPSNRLQQVIDHVLQQLSRLGVSTTTPKDLTTLTIKKRQGSKAKTQEHATLMSDVPHLQLKGITNNPFSLLNDE